VKSRQLSFHSSPAFKDHKPRQEHGGAVRKGKRKLARPFSPDKAMHITLRSSRARGKWSFLKGANQKKIENLIYSRSSKYGVKILQFANVGNHIHLLMRASSKKNFQNYLRVLAGIIPRKVTGARKGVSVGKFWDDLIYSKIVSWGRQFNATNNYVFRNALEGFGVIPPRSESRGHVKINFLDFFDG
jgi:REP element-mobilizing transposase RayT